MLSYMLAMQLTYLFWCVPFQSFSTMNFITTIIEFSYGIYYSTKDVVTSLKTKSVVSIIIIDPPGMYIQRGGALGFPPPEISKKNFFINSFEFQRTAVVY